MKNVNIISTVVQKSQPGKRVPTGNTIIVQGGGGEVDIDKVLEEVLNEIQGTFLSRVNNDSAKGVIDFLSGFAVAGHVVSRVLGVGEEGDVTDSTIMSSARVIEEFDKAVGTISKSFLSAVSLKLTIFTYGFMLFHKASNSACSS